MDNGVFRVACAQKRPKAKCCVPIPDSSTGGSQNMRIVIIRNLIQTGYPDALSRQLRNRRSGSGKYVDGMPSFRKPNGRLQGNLRCASIDMGVIVDNDNFHQFE